MGNKEIDITIIYLILLILFFAIKLPRSENRAEDNRTLNNETAKVSNLTGP